MPHIFISYAHNDRVFTDRLIDALTDALKAREVEIWIDVRNEHAGVEWERQLNNAIREADALLYLFSKNSADNPRCQREINEAVEYKKRIVPIRIDGVHYEKLPPPIKPIHFVDCREGEDDFDVSGRKILEDIFTDYEWVRFHTDLGIDARKWQENNKDAGYLLGGSKLRHAEQQLASAGSSKDPAPTDLQRDFVGEGRKAEENRRRITKRNILAISTILIFLCGIASFGAIVAYIQSKNAAQSAMANATAQMIAGKKGTIALAQQLSVQARQLSNKQGSSPLVASLLALESEERFPNAEADEIIRQSIYGASDQSELLQSYKDITTSHEKEIKSIDFSPDGKFIASGSSDGTARILDINSGAEVAYYQSSGQVDSVQFSPDTKILYVSSDDGHLRSWDIKSAAPILDLYHGEFNVNFDLSADGKIGVSGGTDGIVHIWDAQTGKEIADANHNNNTPISFVAISPDGTKVASVGEDNFIKVWNSRDGKLITQKATDSYFVWLAFTPDSQKIISNSDQPSSDLWDVNTGKVLTQFDSYSVIKYLFSPDGNFVAILEVNSKKIGIWDSGTGKLVSSLPHDAFVFKIGFSRDGKYLASLSLDGTVKVWDPKTGQELGKIIKNGTLDFSFGPKGDLIALPGDKTIYLWRISSSENQFALPNFTEKESARIDPTGKWIASFAQTKSTATISDIASNTVKAQIKQDNPITSLGFSSDGSLAVTGDETGKSCVWKIPTGENITCFSQKGRVNVVAISPDLKLAATAQSPGLVVENYLTIWNIQTGEKLFETNQGFLIEYLTFSPNNKLVAVAGTEGYIVLWDIGSRKEIGHLKYTPTQLPTDAVTFDPNGKWIITSGGDGAHAWDVDDLKEVSHIEYDFNEFFNLDTVLKTVISPDQTQFASVNTTSLRNITLDPQTKREATIRIWDPLTGKEKVRMVHNSWVNDIVWSPDGKYVLSAGDDGIVRIWDTDNGNEVGRIAQDPTVIQLQFTPDGKQIISLSNDGIYKISYWRPEDIISQGCSRMTRNLTLEEWHQYIGDEPYQPTCPNLPSPIVVTGTKEHPTLPSLLSPIAITATIEASTSVPTSTRNNSDQTARISDEVVEVNLRQTPGYNNKNNDTDVIVKIPAGALVKIVGGPEDRDGLTWWKVSWNDYEGWIADHTHTGSIIMVFNP